MLQKIKAVLRNSFLILVVLSIFFAGNATAQETKNVVVSLNEKALGNLKSAIKSENPGLRKSGIYLAGKYALSDISETLIEQLKVEEDPELKILMIRVLYIIDNDKYMDEIYHLANKDENKRVRRMASAVFSAMQVNNSLKIVDNEISNGNLK